MGDSLLLTLIYTVGHFMIAVACVYFITGAPLELATIDAIENDLSVDARTYQVSLENEVGSIQLENAADRLTIFLNANRQSSDSQIKVYIRTSATGTTALATRPSSVPVPPPPAPAPAGPVPAGPPPNNTCLAVLACIFCPGYFCIAGCAQLIYENQVQDLYAHGNVAGTLRDLSATHLDSKVLISQLK